jgi:P27 family predicted phage terminase small subunit
MKARGDGLTPGHRRVTPPGTSVVVQGRIDRKIAFDHRSVRHLMPKNLGPAGKAIFWRMLDNGPWLHPLEDAWLLQQVAKNCDRVAEFERIVESQGPTIDGGYKGVSEHPLLPAIDRLDAATSRYLSKLGFSPTDRARLGQAEVATANSLADLQARTNGPR